MLPLGKLLLLCQLCLTDCNMSPNGGGPAWGTQGVFPSRAKSRVMREQPLQGFICSLAGLWLTSSWKPVLFSQRIRRMNPLFEMGWWRNFVNIKRISRIIKSKAENRARFFPHTAAGWCQRQMQSELSARTGPGAAGLHLGSGYLCCAESSLPPPSSSSPSSPPSQSPPSPSSAPSMSSRSLRVTYKRAYNGCELNQSRMNLAESISKQRIIWQKHFLLTK